MTDRDDFILFKYEQKNYYWSEQEYLWIICTSKKFPTQYPIYFHCKCQRTSNKVNAINKSAIIALRASLEVHPHSLY